VRLALHTDANRASARSPGNYRFRIRSASGLLTRSSQETFEQPGIARPCFEQDGARHSTGSTAESERDDDYIIQRTNHGKELRNQVDGRDDPYHRHQDGDLRATRHAWVLAQATDHGDAGGDESGQFLHEPRRESGGQQDQHRPRREQAPEGDKTYCPYKGECAYYSIPAGGERSVNAVWTYEAPYAAVSAIREYLAFYPDRVDAIEVGVED